MSAWDWFEDNVVKNHYTPWGYITYEKPQDRTQYYLQSLVGGFLPPVGAYHNLRDSMAYMDDYLRNKGFDYDDIRYPSRTVGYIGGHAFGSGLRSVSKNVESLYSPDAPRNRRQQERFKYGMKQAFNDGRLWEQSYRWHKYRR